MMSVEWAYAGTEAVLLEGDDEAGDGNIPSAGVNKDFIAVTWEGIALYGEPEKVLKSLIDASRLVVEHMQEHADV